MNVRLAAIVAASALAIFLIAFIAPAQATITQVVGGPGGSPFTIQCPEGTAVVGFHANAGAWIDGVALLCQGKAGDRQQVGLAGGNGGSPQESYCPKGQFVTSVFMTYTMGNDLPRQYVNTFGFGCGSDGQRGGCIESSDDMFHCEHREVSNGILIPDLKDADKLSCPRDEVLTGLNGRYGNYVDAIGAICGPEPVAKLELAAGAAKMTYEAIGPGMENNTDRLGSDYAEIDLPETRPELCENACFSQRDKCRAWTYVRPGVKGRGAICYLKTPAPAPAVNKCCISGTVEDPTVSSITRKSSLKPAAGPVVGEPGGFAGPAPTMTGVFDTDFGQLMLTSSDGMYSQKNGHVKITKIYGDFMDGTWSQSVSSQQCDDGSYRGTFHFRFTADGFTGTYGYCDGPTNAGPWNGKRR